MDRFRNLFPGGDLRQGPNPGGAGCTGGTWRDVCCFGDEQGSWDAGALGVVFLDEIEWDVFIVGFETRHWCHDDAVVESDVAEFERLEDFGGGGVDHGCG